ncbi:unnamed protein product [Durusdinium trenchii]|uniref:Uncharacterized protein n=1 Tax=Durusdinium trenchii TaxID=1381693 RepID=A0ABP0J9Y0_9DINO
MAIAKTTPLAEVKTEVAAKDTATSECTDSEDADLPLQQPYEEVQFIIDSEEPEAIAAAHLKKVPL